MKFFLGWLLLVGILFTTTRGEEDECVESEKCSCSKTNAALHYQCLTNNVTISLTVTPGHLKIDCSEQIPEFPDVDIFPNVNVGDLKHLTVTFCPLPSNGFNSILEKFKIKSLPHLALHKNELNTVNKNLFAGLTQLKYLNLNNNKITKVDDDAFTELVNLGAVDFTSNDLHLIPSNIFKHNTALEYVSLVSNPNLNLSDYVFANLPKLQRVDIDNCNLENLPPNTFKGSVNLFEISLKNNKIAELPEYVFENLTELNSLHLDGNKIKALPNNIFSSLASLQLLNLSRNELEEINDNAFRGTRSLRILKLSHNKIARVSVNAFIELKQLVNLDLSHNLYDLSYGDGEEESSPFRGCEQLDILLLSHNVIKKFPENVVNTNANLAALELSHNKIEYINMASLIKKSPYSLRISVENNNVSVVDFQDLIKKLELNGSNNTSHENAPPAVLYLSNNPIKCDSNDDLIQYIDNKLNNVIKTLVYIDIKDLHCATPEPLTDALKEQLIIDQNNMAIPQEDGY